MERSTRCIVGWAAEWGRDEGTWQRLLDATPAAACYFSDNAGPYQALVYAGEHHALTNKSQTYSVEGDNADLRHYLARLARRSRCFSRSLDALRAAIRLFVYCYNQRQLHKRRFPRYPAHLFQFLSF